MNPRIIDVINAALDQYDGDKAEITAAKEWLTIFKPKPPKKHNYTPEQVAEILKDLEDDGEFTYEEALAFMEANPSTPEEIEELKQIIAESEAEEAGGFPGYTLEETMQRALAYLHQLKSQEVKA